VLLFYNGTLDFNDWTFVKFFIDNIWLVLTALVSGAALAWPVLTRSKHNLTILQATQLINKGNALIVDVRAPEEFAAGHLRSAKNIPLRELAARINELDKSKPVLVVCTAGVQSVKGAVQLAQAGFAEVYSLDGGFGAWQAQGLPVAK
jgi:rhodanese-related sulfurtransferase